MANFPTTFDTEDNLYLVHDGLRTTLAEDYTPGDDAITTNDNPLTLNFPPSGIITLTDQCNVVQHRAISFEYTGITTTGFTGLSLLSGFTDVVKPKSFTDVTMNVVAPHHNNIKDALIAIENMAGRRGDIASKPQTGTMEARIHYLRNLVLKPKAWFGVDNQVGVAPFTVNIQDLSVRAPNTYIWDFGDGNTQTLTFPYVPGQAEGTSTAPTGSTSHTYTVPGSYDLSLTVTNPFGTNSITINDLISVRTEAPDQATIEFAPLPTQNVNAGVIRSKTHTPIAIEVASTGEQSLDSITTYTWGIADDLLHPSSPTTEAQFSVGGQYDVRLRVDTTLGSYRITTFPNVIDVIEKRNLWLSVFSSGSGATKNTSTYEFGLLSEVFKNKTYNNLSVTRNSTFLNSLPNSSQQVREFNHNNGFTARNMVSSGSQGSGIMYWQESQDVIRVSEFNGFTDTYGSPTIGTDNSITRQWNWTSLNSPQTVYFAFGTQGTSDLTNPNLQSLDLGTLTTGSVLLSDSHFENGSEELLTNVGDGTQGEFSVYRSCWKDSTGFILRNDSTGSFFRLKSFYRTEGVLSDPVKILRKMPDMPGTAVEGQLVGLTGGVYFFSNSGQVSVYNPTTNIWHSYGPGFGSPTFTALQDNTVNGYDSTANTLLATGDGDRIAYLSFDYSNKTFVKFNEIDATFTRLQGPTHWRAIYDDGLLKEIYEK